MTHTTVSFSADPATAPCETTELRQARFRRGVDTAALEREVRRAFAALAANRPYSCPAAAHVDPRIRDEARILRLLFVCGPQPAIEIGGHQRPRVVSVIAREAACEEPASVDAAIEELRAAGLVALAPEALSDDRRYAVLQEHSGVAAAILAAARPPFQRTTLCLTSLGMTLCRPLFDAYGVEPPGPLL